MWTIVIGMETGYKFDKHLAGWIGKSQWLTKCKGLDGERGVRDSTQVSALGKELLFSETGNTESLGMGHGSGWATLSVVWLWSIQVEMSNRQSDVR